MRYNIPEEDFRCLTQRQQVGELYEHTLSFCQYNNLEVNFKNCKKAFSDFEEKITYCQYLEDRVLNELEIKGE